MFLQIENTAEALHDWVLKLIEEFGARGNLYVATEKARGALLYTLMLPATHALPAQLEGYREAARGPTGRRGQKRPLGLPPASRTGQTLPPPAAGLAAR